jgi:hypothetical protein
MIDDAQAIAAYVDASAAVMQMPLDAERREAVIATMTRLAAFAADVATVALADDVEVAGVFVP